MREGTVHGAPDHDRLARHRRGPLLHLGRTDSDPHLSHHSRLTLSTFYAGTLIAMVVFLAGAILAHVGQLEALQRGIFAGLFVLSLYMLFRGTRGRTVLRMQHDGWWPIYVDHIGFTLISLFEGFIIVSGSTWVPPAG